METNNNDKIARENIFKESQEASGISIKGYDFDKGVDYEALLDSYMSMGAQASNMAKAIEIIKEARKEGAFIYFGYTSNMVTGGLRDIFKYLVKHKLVDVIVTTTGGIEEDFLKCLGDFKLGNFRLKGGELRDKGINRAGNVLISNDRYCKFEEFLIPILEKHKDEILTPSKLIHLLGKEINNEESIYYWAQKNNIPVFCPAITDGSIGDMIYFFKTKNPEFKIDVAEDIVKINDSTFGKEKTAAIILGAGVIKHHILNANLFRNGADYAVFINNAQEHDGSDAGALPEEAISWGKLTKECKSVKVYGDASIIFPLIVAKTFAKD
jgi:deoxyhypusine synthase